MKDTTYILIPGLGDQKPIFGWFYRRIARHWSRRGMPTRVASPKWEVSEAFETKLKQITDVIDEEKRADRKVVLVGISAGAALGLLVFCRNRGVECFISVAGFTQLSSSDRTNKTYMKLTWYQAAERAEQEMTGLTTNRRADILSLYGRSDDVIEPTRQQIDDAQNFEMKSAGHLLSIVVALTAYRRVIKRFVASRGWE